VLEVSLSAFGLDMLSLRRTPFFCQQRPHIFSRNQLVYRWSN